MFRILEIFHKWKKDALGSCLIYEQKIGPGQNIYCKFLMVVLDADMMPSKLTV